MKVAVFDARSYDRECLSLANASFGHVLTFFEARLTRQTSALVAGFEAICSFVNDELDRATIEAVVACGARVIALRSAGYNHVDLAAARRFGIPVLRVPEYSPHAVAEHALALVLTLNRKIHRAHARVREGNFSLEGLVGFDLYGKTVGLLGTGRIGSAAARIFRGFGCRVLACDVEPSEALARDVGVAYVSTAELYGSADIISLHVPLTPETHHLIDADALSRTKRGVMIINTGRGALIDTRALIAALKSGQVGAAGLDVYEEEEGVFFRDLSDRVLQDDILARLLTFPNVLMTSHQAFLTREALQNIAVTTLRNIRAFERGDVLENEVRAEEVLRDRAPE